MKLPARKIASRILLAIFLPMLMLSSVHVHKTTIAPDTECAQCVHHQCHGHLTQQWGGSHPCLLCQFLTLSFVVTTAIVVTYYNNSNKKLYSHHQHKVYVDVMGLPALRAPPYV